MTNDDSMTSGTSASASRGHETTVNACRDATTTTRVLLPRTTLYFSKMDTRVITRVLATSRRERRPRGLHITLRHGVTVLSCALAPVLPVGPD